MAPSSSASNSAFKPIRDAVDRAEALHSDEEDSAGARAKQPRLSQDGGDAEGAGAMDEDRNRGWEGEGGEAGYHPVDQIESLCMECHEQVGRCRPTRLPRGAMKLICIDVQGTTRLLLTMIPYFKEVIIMSFRCPHCGESQRLGCGEFPSIFPSRRADTRPSACTPCFASASRTGCTNTEIQSAGQIQELGSAHTVKLTTREDLNRQLVKSAYATLTIPEYELTLPPGKGQLTTIESIISHTIEDIGFDQPARKHLDPTNYEKIEAVLDRLRAIVAEGQEAKENLDKPFTVKLEDPSGNSFIEAKGGFGDPKWSMRAFRRTMEQNEALGLAKAETGQGAEAAGTGSGPVLARPSRNQAAAALAEKTLTDDYVADKPDEVLSFPDICSSCGATLETYMKTVDIPHFKEVVLMSTNCHSCGYRDNEIKSGGAIAAKGRKITLRVEDSEDLSRDILKVGRLRVYRTLASSM